jgi:hypothetical protein
MTPDALFMARALDEQLPYVHATGWATTAPSLAPLGEPMLAVTLENRETLLMERDGVLLSVGLGNGWASVEAAARERGEVEAVLRWLREVLPAPDPSATHEVPVTFWTYGPHGPVPAVRTIAVPEWDEISTNYSAATRQKLDGVMRGFQPAHGGQLVLWHGKAGTGKTFALRALAWEWRDWCEFHYVVDPDSLFGQHADYLMSVLMQPAGVMTIGAGAIMQLSMGGGYDEDESEHEAKAWRVLVLEDTGELLTPDAKSIIGQGLSRFLNVVDGLIGQGLRVLVLVTTNEEIRTLHPAVSRPGRCAANVDFRPLDAEEATRWLDAHAGGGTADAPRTLASLYAQVEGWDPADAGRAVGFAEPV